MVSIIQVLVGQSSGVTNNGSRDITGTISFIPTLNHQDTNVTCTGQNTSNGNMEMKRVRTAVMMNLWSK